MAEKVYCKECANLTTIEGCGTYCNATVGSKVVPARDTPYEHIEEKIVNRQIWNEWSKYNKDNNCKFFKNK